MEDSEAFGSGVGVLDKAALVLSALEAGPAPLAQLVATTGLARPTAHRLAVALEYHRFVARDMQGRFVLGPRLQELASSAGEDRLLAAAMPVLIALRNHTKESTQLFRRQGDFRVCVAASEREMGLRASIPVGAACMARLSMRRCSRKFVAEAGRSRLQNASLASHRFLPPFEAPPAEFWQLSRSLAPSSAWDVNRDASTAPPRLRQPIGSRISSAPQKEWKTKTRQPSRAGNTPPLSQ